MIYILTYNAPHRKTQDLLFRLKAKGYKDIKVLAIPWVERKNFSPLIPHRKFDALNIFPKDLCAQLNYDFLTVQIEDISQFNDGYILIGGAGMLPNSVVESGKVINSHPAYLPYVRGLDSLKWAIYHDKPIGVTTHIISDECDAGKLINQKLVPIYSWDTFHSLAFRQYELEINMLSESIEDIKTASLEELSTKESNPMRRMPHSVERELLGKFQKIVDNIE